MENGNEDVEIKKICDCDVKRQLPEVFAAHRIGGRKFFVSGYFKLISTRLTPCWRVSTNIKWVTGTSQAWHFSDANSCKCIQVAHNAFFIAKITRDNENCQRCADDGGNSSYPTFLVPHQTSEKSEEKSHGNVFLPFFLVLKYGKPSQLMNLTPSVTKDKIFVFFMFYKFFCSRVMHDYFKFSTEKGCKHIKHDDELLWIQLHTQSSCWCSIAWYFLFYLLCFLISYREWEAYAMCRITLSARKVDHQSYQCHEKLLIFGWSLELIWGLLAKVFKFEISKICRYVTSFYYIYSYLFNQLSHC